TAPRFPFLRRLLRSACPPPAPPPGCCCCRSSRRDGVAVPPGAAEAIGRGGMNDPPLLATGRGRGAPGVIGRGRGRSAPPPTDGGAVGREGGGAVCDAATRDSSLRGEAGEGARCSGSSSGACGAAGRSATGVVAS